MWWVYWYITTWAFAPFFEDEEESLPSRIFYAACMAFSMTWLSNWTKVKSLFKSSNKKIFYSLISYIKMTAFKIVTLLLFLLTACQNSTGKKTFQELSGKVIAVKDGDTIEILYEGKPLTIRFAHVDCPELKKKQPYGTAAKQFTSDLCFGETVTVQHEKKYDRYKRLIGVVVNKSGKNVNKELVKAGYAWHFKQYSTDVEYDQLEQIARHNKAGLWADRHPTPPWEWRAPKPKKKGYSF